MTQSKIPYPPRYPFIGNLPQIFGENTMQDLMRIAEHYGPIFEMKLPKGSFYVVTNHELGKVVLDDQYFHKKVTLTLNNLRHFAGDGLFTAHTEEANWGIAHRILMPGFGMKQMVDYVPRMHEIAGQLIDKWEAVGPSGVDVTEDYTRLTLDTIALCGFDYRFHSFASKTLHPFLDAMVYSLSEALRRMKLTSLQMAFVNNDRWEASKNLMFDTVDQLIRERMQNLAKYEGKVDFLSLMINGVDRVSGLKMSDENIRYNLITFLVAGHETTSGLLSFASYFLMKNPEIQAKAREEALRVLGPDRKVCPDFKQVSQLRYINQVLKETLRITPSVPIIGRAPREDINLGGRYQLKKGDIVRPLISMIQNDPAVWENPRTFDPDRFSPEREANIPAYAFTPFGVGERACIGQHFALVEAALCLGMVLQNFELVDDRNYQLKYKETITIKPKDFTLTLKLRQKPNTPPAHAPAPPPSGKTISTSVKAPSQKAPAHATPLAIYYGSNMGTSEDLANRLLHAARKLGFFAQMASLDEAVDSLPNTGIVLIVTATYNGVPPDNAKKFASWMRSSSFRADGVKYAVFGCGNSQWKTFQAFPRELDERLSKAGAQRLGPSGEADAAADFEGAFERWHNPTWQQIVQGLGLGFDPLPYLEQQDLQFAVQVIDEAQVKPLFKEYDAKPFRVMDNRELQHIGGDTQWDRATRHIELLVPEGLSYHIGDHIGIIARNRESLVRAVAQRLGYGLESIVTLMPRNQKPSFLPTRQGVSLWRLLTEYIDLQEIASRAQVAWLANCCMVTDERQILESWSRDDETGRKLYNQEVLEKRRSIFDLLSLFKSCDLPLDVFFEMANPIRPRYYSISSSALKNPRLLSITVGVVSGPSMAQNGTFKGVCSSYLQTREIGDVVWGFVKSPAIPFRLPETRSLPMIMIGPGTGIAPFRGFLQERDTLMKQGERLGEAFLFFGCRKQRHDFLYQSELEDFHKRGVCRLFTAFSHDEGSEFRFVQEKLWHHRNEVWQLLEQGAMIYVCGDGMYMAPDVRATFKRIYQEAKGADEIMAETWVSNLEERHRYVSDVFGQKKT